MVRNLTYNLILGRDSLIKREIILERGPKFIIFFSENKDRKFILNTMQVKENMKQLNNLRQQVIESKFNKRLKEVTIILENTRPLIQAEHGTKQLLIVVKILADTVTIYPSNLYGVNCSIDRLKNDYSVNEGIPEKVITENNKLFRDIRWRELSIKMGFSIHNGLLLYKQSDYIKEIKCKIEHIANINEKRSQKQRSVKISELEKTINSMSSTELQNKREEMSQKIQEKKEKQLMFRPFSTDEEISMIKNSEKYEKTIDLKNKSMNRKDENDIKNKGKFMQRLNLKTLNKDNKCVEISLDYEKEQLREGINSSVEIIIIENKRDNKLNFRVGNNKLTRTCLNPIVINSLSKIFYKKINNPSKVIRELVEDDRNTNILYDSINSNDKFSRLNFNKLSNEVSEIRKLLKINSNQITRWRECVKMMCVKIRLTTQIQHGNNLIWNIEVNGSVCKAKQYKNMYKLKDKLYITNTFNYSKFSQRGLRWLSA